MSSGTWRHRCVGAGRGRQGQAGQAGQAGAGGSGGGRKGDHQPRRVFDVVVWAGVGL